LVHRDGNRWKPRQWRSRMMQPPWPITTGRSSPGQKSKSKPKAIPVHWVPRRCKTLINGDIGGFRGQARELADLAVSLLAAIRSRNAEQLGKLAGELDEACEECHVKYWYPPPK
ncbi:MAG: hypothetical protein ACRD3S_01390, partial [Terracidiphilus sp.]